MARRDSRQAGPCQPAGARRRTAAPALATLVAATLVAATLVSGVLVSGAPAALAATAGCPDDVGAILRSMRQLRSSAAKKQILDPLADCLSVADFVRELRFFRPSPALSRAFLEVSRRQGLTAEDARAILAGSYVLTSVRTRQEVMVELIEEADRDDLLRAARTLPGPQLEKVLDRLVAYDTAINDPPVAQAQTVRTRQGHPVDVRLSANETGYIAFTILTLPRHGTLEVLADSSDTVRYTPEPGYTGQDGFTFKANDGQLDSREPATVTILVGRR